MATRRLSGIASSSSVPDNGGDHSGGGGGSAGGYVDDVFSTYVYAGDGTDRDIENGIDLAGEGGLVWHKRRTGTIESHYLYDTERGAPKGLQSNLADAESDTGTGALTSFNSNGFTYGIYQEKGHDYASWTFRKAKNFFDVVTYTGDGVAGREIPHNLGVKPGMIIVKRLESGYSWQVYHRGTDAVAPENYYLQLDRPNAREVDTGNGRWGGAAPTEQDFTVGNSPATNESGSEYIAYLFAQDDSDESIIKCGSYTGNGSNDGPEIDLGFEPQWMMIKGASTGGCPWQIIDSMRGIESGGSDSILKPNEADAEGAYEIGSLTPTGFKITNNAAWSNANGDTYTYVAIRRPTKPASEYEPEELFAIEPASSI